MTKYYLYVSGLTQTGEMQEYVLRNIPQRYNKNIFSSATINSTKCAKFCTFNLFHYLSKFSNNDLYQKRKQKQIKLKKTIVTERQILKTLNITHCRL